MFFSWVGTYGLTSTKNCRCFCYRTKPKHECREWTNTLTGTRTANFKKPLAKIRRIREIRVKKSCAEGLSVRCGPIHSWLPRRDHIFRAQSRTMRRSLYVIFTNNDSFEHAPHPQIFY